MTKIYRNPRILYLCLVILIYDSYTVFSQTRLSKQLMQGEVMKDDGQIITSDNQDFAFGFFSPGNSSFRYVGVWYNNIQDKTVVWVANRNNPISGKSGLLSFGDDGNLRLTNGNDSKIIWSTNISSVSINSSITVRDTGNLALCRSEDIDNNNKALWQSFSHPTDTFLPEMRVYTMSQTQNLLKLVSWKSPSDPSEGNYSMAFDPRGSPQIVVWEGLNHRIWRSGHWNGLIFIGVPNSRARFTSGFGTTTDNNGDTYFTYTAANRSQFVRFNILRNGKTDQLIWDDSKQVWNVAQSQPTDECGNYNRCGDFGLCSIKDPERCSCIKGFGPKSEDEWRRGNWSGGCIRKKALKCDKNGTNDGFLQVEGVKLPDFADVLASETNLDGCEDKCTKNCSCSAYGYVVGIGCMVYGGELVDIEHLEGGNTLFVRVSNSELGGKKSVSSAAIIAIAVVGTIIIGIILWAFWRFRGKIKVSWKKQSTSLLTARGRSQELSAEFLGVDELSAEGKQGTGPHLPLFSFTFVEIATDYFAIQNKLGQGGFGPVYKGVLPGGQEVAVKRLSKMSGQGLEEFKTEVILIAKLQHRNLVRLLGCCIEGEEKLLIYEYMPNKSLDSFLFDARQRSQLHWSRRYAIIEGVARGLLYLHRDSRLRIIHRDLKASNILLDEEMQPKISDFGMARIFGGNQIEANTIRVVGTYGYMSPEYAMEGLFSVKSDVYSFGVLLLEIVSGQRNNTFHSPDCTNLIRYAWNLWKDGKTEEMIDPVIADSRKIVLQCIHVGMLCVQMSAAHRPTMSQVLNMLESESTSLPLPRVPDMSSMNSVEMESAMRDNDINLSSTEVTVTEVIGSTVNTSSERYLGIWFNKIPEQHIVWVANRNDPIVTKDAVFKINTDGNIVIFSDKSATKLLWSSNISDNVSTMNPTAKLLDSGNLELTVAEGSHGRKRMWQSFDYPTDTILPGMKLGLDRKTGLNRVMTSWKSKDNPAEGEFIMTLETEGLPQFFLRQKNSDTPIWRAGPWNGVILSGVARLSGNLKTPVVDFSQFASLFNYTYIDTKDEVYMTLTSPKTGRFRKYVMNFKGLAQQSFYHATDDKSEYTIYTNKWVPFWSAPNPSDGCDKYMTCGKNSICNSSNSSTTNCTCLPGYERESDLVHCKKKRKDLNVCRKGNGGGFVKLTGIKLPDSRHARYIADFSLKECEVECLKSCKCNSYASANVQIGGKGCYLWEGELNDIKAYQDGQEFYLRVDSIELAGSKKSTKRIPAVVIFLIVIFGVILLLSCLYVCRKYTVRKGQRQNQRYRDMMLAVSDAETTNDFTTADNLTDNSNIDLTFFDLDTIIRATDNFSPAKKLGQGSFGPVFKGELSNGHEIAVKRLSRTSGQGISEFKNEALLIAKLQHRNLVRLLGCCIDEEEKMLIYEYMPNKSLDYFIFDESKKSMLNWRKRHEIIVGIARGILYLHQDSRLKIIHRDLKASNILLDIELNPKISDFGTARIFGGNQVEANTCRVVGTFGYMSPEYALDGYFSVKSDVYSFGVLLLEIISGKKNNRYFEDIPNSSLIKHVWESWSNDRALEIADTSIPEDFLPAHEVLRCIQVGLLCVQDNPADRPTMSTIVFMLSNEATLPSPKQPMVAVCRSADNTDTTSAGTRSSSINGVTMTNLSAR